LNIKNIISKKCINKVVSNNYVALGCSHFSRPHLHFVALLVLLSGSKEPHNRLLTSGIKQFFTASCQPIINVCKSALVTLGYFVLKSCNAFESFSSFVISFCLVFQFRKKPISYLRPLCARLRKCIKTSICYFNSLWINVATYKISV